MTSTSSVDVRTDEMWMRRCLALAELGRGRTAPNPMVGAVVVGADGALLAEGWHRGPGLPHAEVDALAQLGGVAEGATLYVNLEPCNHFGRTPPCARAVVAAGVARVVFGMRDPIPGHGGGAAHIALRGIDVEVGVLEDECRALNERWVEEMLDGVDVVVMPAATSHASAPV